MKDPEILKKLQEFKEQVELHEHYKKHQKSPEKEGDEDPFYINWNVSLCCGCHMPIDNEGNVTEHALETFISNAKKYKHPLTYIVAMQERIDKWGKTTDARSQDWYRAHLRVDKMMAMHKDYLRLKRLHNAFRNELTDPVGDIREPYLNLIRFEMHIMDGITEESKDGLRQVMEKKDDTEGTNRRSWDREEASTAYLALALHHGWEMDRKTFGLVMRKSRNIPLKQEATARTGKFRVSAIRGTEFKDCLPSYYYVLKYKPELLQDEAWVAKKLRFDKSENRLVILRYFMDTGLGLKYLKDDDKLMCAAARFTTELKPEAAPIMKEWRSDQERGDRSGYLYVFGDKADRKRLYTVDDEYHLIGMCDTLEEFFQHVLREDRYGRRITKDPVADVIGLPGQELDEDDY